MTYINRALAKLLPAAVRKFTKDNAGMSLLEIIIVIALIGGIMTVIISQVTSSSDAAQKDTAMIAMQNLGSNLQIYRVHNKRYPTTEEGLNALITQPGDAKRWRGPYVDENKLIDPWGNNFAYERDGKNFRIISPGPDNSLGTEDDMFYPEKTEG